MSRFLLLLVASTYLANAQFVNSGSNAVSALETVLKSATDVVVAEVVSTSATVNEPVVQEKAVVRVVRVLAGDLAVGAEIPLDWEFDLDLNGRSANLTEIKTKGALWFLRKRGESYEALRSHDTFPMLDCFMMSARKTAPQAELFYASDAPLEYKLAREEAAVLASEAGKNALRGVAETARLLRQFSPSAMAGVYRYFEGSTDIYLKTFGIEGEMVTGHAEAVLGLENDLPRLAPALRVLPLTEVVMAVDAHNLAAMHSLARMALGETDLSNLDGMLGSVLGRSGSLEMLPYLEVLMESPNVFTSYGAIYSICTLMRFAGGTAKAGPLTPEMQAHCPDHSPLNDRGQAQADVSFWHAWWVEHKAEMAKTIKFAQANVPARYHGPAGAAPMTMESRAITPEMRFGMLMGMSALPTLPFTLSAEDNQAFHEVATRVNARIAEQRRRFQKGRTAAPDASEWKAFQEETAHIYDAGMDDARGHLSSEGWQTIEKFLKDSSGSGVMVGVPIMLPPAKP